MTVFNRGNTGHHNGYKLFLGEDLGITDTVNIQHPVLEELYQLQRSQDWNEFEVDLYQDKLDMINAPKELTDLMVKTLMWQTAADSIASRSLGTLFGRFTTDSTLNSVFAVWTMFEDIHARTYSHIIKQTMDNPQDVFDQLYDNNDVIERLRPLVAAFNNLATVDASNDKQCREAIYLAMVAFFALESTAFMASFAVTFTIANTGIFQGISSDVGLVARDEQVHTRFAHYVLQTIRNDPDWSETVVECKDKVKTILDAVVQGEEDSAHYLFSEGREVIGLNAELLIKYVDYKVTPVYESLGLEHSRVLLKNPLKGLDKYFIQGKVQTANMELQNTAYLTGTIIDDSANLDLSRFKDIEL